MEISRSQYPGTTVDRLNSYLYRMHGLSSEDRKVAESYAKRLLTFSRMKPSAKKDRYKSKIIDPFYDKARENEVLGGAIKTITGIVFSEVNLG